MAEPQIPADLIWVIVGASMPGVRHGDVVLVDPNDPEIAALMSGALLVPSDPPSEG